ARRPKCSRSQLDARSVLARSSTPEVFSLAARRPKCTRSQLDDRSVTDDSMPEVCQLETHL
ncbi:MAG: hypothetical protein IJU23_13890, partial [Proteobacteria bacterium]|nr:hypothetical protein [Pseudomonadota bacterium]